MEEDWRAILDERIEERGFYLYYDPPGDGMCFYNAAGELLDTKGYRLKCEIFKELRANRFDVDGNDRLTYISDDDIGQECSNDYERDLALLEDNWANHLVVKTLPIICERTLIILTPYGEKPEDYVFEFKVEDPKGDPIHLGYTGKHYVALEKASKVRSGEKPEEYVHEFKVEDSKGDPIHPGYTGKHNFALKKASKRQDSNDQKRNSERLTMPTYKVTFRKRGLDAQEFRQSVEDKLQQIDFVGDVMNWKASVDKVIQSVCIIEAKTTGKLDQRRKSNEEYVKSGLLPDVKTSPTKLLESQRGEEGKQGQQRCDKETRKGYHSKQHELFENVWLKNEMFKDIFHSEERQICSQGKISALYFKSKALRPYERRLSTIEFCNVVDKITMRYLKDDKFSPDEVGKVYKLCLDVSRGRFLGDMYVENDLMNQDSYNQWRDHFLVLMSFSVLCVVLHGLKKKANKKRDSWVLHEDLTLN